MDIVKRHTYHKNRVIKQQSKLKHSLQHSANDDNVSTYLLASFMNCASRLSMNFVDSTDPPTYAPR